MLRRFRSYQRRLRRGALLIFCVGATEEVFTQCSQNLFIKRALPEAEARRRAARPPSPTAARRADRRAIRVVSDHRFRHWPSRRIATQRRSWQDRFRRAARGPDIRADPVSSGQFRAWSRRKALVQSYGSLLVHDDTETGAAVTISGACSILTHLDALRAFPGSAEKVATIKNRKGSPMPDPEYWFAQVVEEILMQRGTLPPYALDPARPTCAIHSGGHALFDKKPAYFAAGSLPTYDPT